MPDLRAAGRVAVSNGAFTIPARRDKVCYMFANGNSFSNGQSMSSNAARIREPWYIRLLGGLQDRGGT